MSEEQQHSPSIPQPFTPIDQQLFETRNIFLNGQVNAELALKINRELLALEKMDPQKPIKIWINSPGGEVYSGMAIYDMIQFIQCPVFTIVTGMAASMGSVIALAAEKERRFALKNSKFLLHQPLIGGQIKGPSSDIEIHALEIVGLKKKLHALYAERTSIAESLYVEMMERDRWVSTEEAISLGLISRVIESSASLASVTP